MGIYEIGEWKLNYFVGALPGDDRSALSRFLHDH